MALPQSGVQNQSATESSQPAALPKNMPRAPHELAAMQQAQNQLKNVPQSTAPSSLMSAPGMSTLQNITIIQYESVFRQ